MCSAGLLTDRCDLGPSRQPCLGGFGAVLRLLQSVGKSGALSSSELLSLGRVLSN